MTSRRALLLLLAAGMAVAADDAPGWLKELADASLPSYGPKVNTVVLLNDESTTVTDAAKLITTTRMAIKVLSRQGEVMFFEQYDTGGSKVRDFKAWTIYANGKVKKYGKDEIMDIACASNDVYNDCRRRAVSNKPDVEVGAVFGYESIVERQLFSSQLSFHFQDSSPVRLARFEVTLPSGWELKSASFNGAPAEAAPAGTTYTWRMENLAAIEPEPLAPAFLSIAPWVGVNVIGPSSRPLLSWTHAAKVLTELNDGQAEPNDAMATKARSLVEGATTELDKIRAIGRFTQQINYVSVQVNVSKGGGYKPHAATQVYQKLYGDCKDKANLTRAMLKAVGITAYPVAIYSGDRTHVNEKWPSLGSFNHAISAIRVSPETQAPAVLDHPKLGRLLLFDSTDPYVLAGSLPDHEQGSLALVGAGDAGDLIRVPVAPARAAWRSREVTAELKADGSISGKFVDRRTGDAQSDAVTLYRSSSRTDYIKMIERWIGRSIPAANASKIEIADDPAAFKLSASFESSRYGQRPQPTMLIFRAALLGHGDVRLPEKTRKHPVVLDADALSETVRIALPSEYKVDEIPPPVRLTSPFGNFEATWTAEPGAIVFQRKLEVPPATVPVSQYAELKRFLDQVAGTADLPVVLVR